jgi:uncharacterized protein
MAAIETLPAVTRAHPVLPIFRIEGEGAAMLYTPGMAVPEASADLHELEQRAIAAEAAWQAYVNRPFEPECLTVYLSNRCNLGCVYCYSAPQDPVRRVWRLSPRVETDSPAAFPVISERAVEAAAGVVAEHCVRKSKPFSLIFHGGGEPTLHWDLLQRLRERVGLVAEAHGLSLWSYLATNGMVADSKAAWLAAQFTLIGLSCDGPPEIHDGNRPFGSGAPSSAVLERTARALTLAGADFHVRATITRSGLRRQRDIVAYCIRVLGARVVRFEPAYQAHAGQAAYLQPDDAEDFVRGFLEARALARTLGGELHVSGVRVGEIHGPYCNPLREVLQLGPNGVASACFLTADDDRPDDAELALGRYDDATNTFVIDRARADALRRRGARIPDRCRSCVNVYHCARDCPDVCLLTAGRERMEAPGFRCRVQKLLAHELIREMAWNQLPEA